MKRQKSQPLLTQFGFKQQRKEIAGMGEFSKYNIFCVYRVPVFIPPIDQKIVYSVNYE